MDIAIIGGGASGMATAYYLSKQGHQVCVYEKQPFLGGNIRTLNKNVPSDSPFILEAGVIEFPNVFHHVIALMDELKVDLEPVDLGSAVFLNDGRHILSSSMIKKNTKGVHSLLEYFRLTEVYASSLNILMKTQLSQWKARIGHRASPVFHDKPVAEYVMEGRVGDNWLKSLIMYSYSIPFCAIDKVPAELALPAMKDYMMADWVRIKGGVYGYIEKILQQLNGNVELNAQISTISRQHNKVQVSCVDRPMREFDKIVFATPPDQVLPLLSDSSEDERRRFASWTSNHMQTVIHTDTSLYTRYGIKRASEFDFFQSQDGWGYNCSLNQLCELPRNASYSLSYNLESLIDKQKIVHIQSHQTPFYTVEALRFRDEVKASNGEQNTYHAGAYLYDGLHEGAITSALHVAEAIG